MKKEITETEKAYFAGLFDGEGCVIIVKGKTSGYDWYNLRVTFSITYADILYKMKNIFKGHISKRNIINRSKEPYISKAIELNMCHPDKWKDIYVYNLVSKDAWVFLKIIEPYCEEKKEQVKTAIDFFNGSRSKYNSKRKSKHEIERCEYYYKKLQELKHGKNSEDKELILTDNQTNFDLFSEV